MSFNTPGLWPVRERRNPARRSVVVAAQPSVRVSQSQGVWYGQQVGRDRARSGPVKDNPCGGGARRELGGALTGVCVG